MLKRHKRLLAAVLASASSLLVVCQPVEAAPVASPTSLALCVGGPSKTFTVTESQGHPSISAAALPTGFVSVSTNQPKSPVIVTVSAVKATPGPVTVTASDSMGSAPVSVTVNGPLAVTSPANNTLAFDGSTVSGTNAQTFTVSDPGPPETLTATLGSGIASFASSGVTLSKQVVTSGGTATFTVFPVGSATGAQASTTIGLSGATSQCSLSSAITVNVTPGSLSLTPSSLTFSALGSANNATFAAQEFNYTGSLSADTADHTIATVTPSATSAPGAADTVTYTVTPVNFGKTTATVRDARPSSASVNVLVSGGTIAISGSSTATFSVSDNTNQHLAATPVRITGSLETTASGGASVFVDSPSDIVGSNNGVLKISYLAYNCTGNGAGSNQGGTFASGFIQLVANSSAGDCVTFGNGAGAGQFANLDFNVNLFLNDLVVPADTYNTSTAPNSPFVVVLSAT